VRRSHRLDELADINGQQIVTRVAQIYSNQTKHLVIEVEIPVSEVDSRRELANVSVSYTNMKTKVTDRLSNHASVRFSHVASEIEKSLNKSVKADVVALISSENSKLATKYLDEGNVLRCREVLQENVDYLKANGVLLGNDKRLKELEVQNGGQLDQLKDVSGNTDSRALSARKSQLYLQNAIDQQQRTVPASGSSNP